MRKPIVFISYSAKGCPPGECAGAGCAQCARAEGERKFVEKLETDLVDFEIQWDRRVLFDGQDWRPKLYTALGTCQAAIILLTESAVTSTYVPLEAMILTWRRLLHPNFVVIPVFFEGFSVDTLRSQTSPYYGIGLEDIQGATRHTYSDETGAVDSIRQGLAAVSAAGDIKEIAVLDSLGAILQLLPDSILDSAKGYLPQPAFEWDPVIPKWFQLAAAILQRPLSKLIPSLQVVLPEIPPDKKKRLYDLVSPQWVDPRAAIPIWQYTLATTPTQPSKVLLINAKEEDTCKCYVRRAWGHKASHVYHIVPLQILGTPPGEELEERVLRAYDLSVNHKGADVAWTSDRRSRVMNALSKRATESLPVYYWVREPDVDIGTLTWIANNIPAAYIIYLYGCQEVDDTQACLLKPQLVDGAEDNAVADLDVLNGFILQE